MDIIPYSEIIELRLDQLNKLIEKIFEELNINEKERDFFKKNMTSLAFHHVPSCKHSLRVAILAYQVGKLLYHQNNVKALFYSGLLHDIGKTEMSVELLDKTDFNERDMNKMTYTPT